MGYGLIKEDTLSDIADAIRAKNELDITYKPSEMAAAIAALSASSDSTASQEGVEFVDHDGTVLYSYTWDEVAELTELPDLPTWTAETVGGFSIPMTCTGWNWSLESIQNYTAQGFVEVGAIYEPTDGRTHMIIWMGVDGDIMLRLTGSVTNAAVTIDWGDGSTTNTTTYSAKTYTHDYGNETDTYYDVTITANNGTAKFTAISTSSSGYIGCMGSTISSSYYSYRWRNGTLRELYVGGAITKVESTAFYYCGALTTVTLPSSLASIGTYAFYGCVSLASITLPDGVTSVRNYAFEYGCSLKSVALPDSLTSIGNYAFYHCYPLRNITLPDGVTSIGDYAFAWCDSLRSITFPDSLTSIGDGVCSCCISLTSVTLPDGVTSIGNFAFNWCCALRSITFPDGLTSIGYYAFRDCTNLTSITLPDSLTSISTNAFCYCYGLTSITLPDTMTGFGTYWFCMCTSLTSVTLPDNMVYLLEYMFYGCYSLVSVNLPSNLTLIGNYAFYQCYSLTSITLPDSLTQIGNYAFQYAGLVTLDGLYIGSSDTATNTFQYCYRLTYLTNVREVNATLYLGESPLDYDSAINLFNGLSDENTGTVTLSSTTYALLDEDDLAIATDKGWTVASA